MHGHVHGITAHLPQPQLGLSAERSAATLRAAAVRRRLLEQAAELTLDDSDDSLWIRQAWGGSDRRRKHRGQSPPTAITEPEREPVSFWA